MCDGIVHCMHGDDENFELCKNRKVFADEATIECVENRPKGLDITILAIPCNNVTECRDGRDENCEETYIIFGTVVSTITIMTFAIHIYWMNFMDKVTEDDDNIEIVYPKEPWKSKGDKLAELKVSFCYRKVS